MRLARQLTVAATLLALSIGAAVADDVSDAMTKAQTAYSEGRLADAKRELDMASVLIAQKNAERLKVLLPAALDGWTANDGEAQAIGAAFMGGGTTVSRTYSKADGTTVQISVITDSPMMAMAMTFVTNPQMAVMSGMKLDKAGEQQLIIAQDGNVQAVVANRFFVTIDGSATAEDKLVYAKAIDYPGLTSFQ
jgi:hypothetical protein